MIAKDQLPALYRNKILAVRNYKSNKMEFGVDDFLDFTILVEVLLEVLTGESDITPAGKKFVELYYGLEHMAEQMSRNKRFTASTSMNTASEIQAWWEGVMPMEIAAFITESRGIAAEPERLREDLLPPKED